MYHMVKDLNESSSSSEEEEEEEAAEAPPEGAPPAADQPEEALPAAEAEAGRVRAVRMSNILAGYASGYPLGLYRQRGGGGNRWLAICASLRHGGPIAVSRYRCTRSTAAIRAIPHECSRGMGLATQPPPWRR